MSDTAPPPDTSAHTPAGHDPQPERDEHGHHVKGPLPKVEGKLGKHRDLIVVVLSILGVLVGYLSYRSSKNKTTAATTAATDPAAAAAQLAAGSGDPTQYTSGYGNGVGSGTVAGYSGDSTAGDPYAGLQSMFQNLSDELAALAPGQSTTPTSPGSSIPSSFNQSWSNQPLTAPAQFLYGQAAGGLRYIRDLSKRTAAIGQVNPNGKIYWMNAAQYAELGQPKYTAYGSPYSANVRPVHPVGVTHPLERR